VAHPKHEQVRQRYGYRCGYCGVTEVDAGGDLTVDHHQPVAAGGDDSDANLVYACSRCNLYKADFVASADNLARGWQVLHPL
jgi:5-methylcytosine-specific restriction endonuclease McrA